MKISLTQLQAFNTVYKLLDSCYEQTKSDDIACLAGDMLFLGDGSTVGPAVWSDWMDAIENKEFLNKQEAFDGMINFLDIDLSFWKNGDGRTRVNFKRWCLCSMESDKSKSLRSCSFFIQ